MHDRFRKEFECIWPRDFVQYYRGKLLPRSGNEFQRWEDNRAPSQKSAKFTSKKTMNHFFVWTVCGTVYVPN